MLKYLFMGSPPFAATILEKLCEELYPPEVIITQVAKAAGRGQKVIPTAVEEYGKRQDITVLTSLDVNAIPTLGALRVFEADLVLVAAFGQILKEDLLKLPRLHCLNVHASLLPRYRGAAPIQRAIWNGDKVTGITIQKMARKLDTGDILLQRELPIEADETSGELTQRLAHLGAECLVEAVKKIEEGTAIFTPQEETLATYARKIDREDALIDWRQPAQKIHDQIRALQPWPVAETHLGKDRLRIFKTSLIPNALSRIPGEILTDAKSQLTVVCGDGRALALTEIQLENRKRLEIKDFLAAYRGSFPYRSMGIS